MVGEIVSGSILRRLKSKSDIGRPRRCEEPRKGSSSRDRLPSAMSKPAHELESKALKLPRKERARLAQRLISSLDPKLDTDVEKLWLQEAERRLGELKSGKIAGIPADKVVRKARSTLR